MMKRILALVLALVLCLGLLTGCGENTEDTEAAGLDYAKTFAKYDPHTLVMTINGEEVTWSEFYYYLYSSITQLSYYTGELAWDDKVVEGMDDTFGDYVMQLALDSAKQFHVISTQAKQDNLTLTDSDREKVAEVVQAFMEQTCGADATTEAFEAFLLENLFLTKPVYEFINENSVLYEKLFAHYIGVNAEKLTDEDVAEFVEYGNYVTAKHILIKTIDAQGAALPEEEKAEAKAKAEEILATLQAVKDRKKLISTFDECVLMYGEDEGQAVFTDGYTFTTGEMYPVFEEAAFALKDYEISGIVESQAGYHILMRLPTTRKSAVDYNSQTGTMYTMENYAATDKYGQLLAQWMENAEVVWEPEFEGITTEKIFD